MDQHAADEKSNFENLSRSTKIESQPIVNPIKLNLSVTDKYVVEQCKEIFKVNGFHVEVPESGEVLIKSLPRVKNQTFSVEDF